MIALWILLGIVALFCIVLALSLCKAAAREDELRERLYNGNDQ